MINQTFDDKDKSQNEDILHSDLMKKDIGLS